MKIAIATIGRFHLLDLARELSSHGHEVYFYSLIPVRRCEEFGLNRSCVTATFHLSGVIEYFCRKVRLPSKLLYYIRNFNNYILMDYGVKHRLKPCDVFIGLSGVFMASSAAARERYGATVIIERGSKHILEQVAILQSVGHKANPFDLVSRREQEHYRQADYISVASEHVVESFIKYGFLREKLFVNPYGTSLSNFHPTLKPGKESYDVIMVGGWSYRKGCDILVEACRQLGVRLLHVGGVIDFPFPHDPLFTHHAPVHEPRLIEFYSQAKVFVLPSREEGLALVQAQALACGLPIVCSRDTGGRDLRKFIDDSKWIVEMPETTAESLADCIKQAMELYEGQPQGERSYAGTAIRQLSWRAYGERYNAFLVSLKGGRN